MADPKPNGNNRSDEHSKDSSPESSPQKDQKPAPKSKDPNRPKRKKARRACAACQRAHLTCGDERPCERCIKRGLQDDCHDGARKKAKYLRDAPDEALQPGAARYYNQNNGGSGSPLDNGNLPQAGVGAVPRSDSGLMDSTQPHIQSFPNMPGKSHRASRGQQDTVTLNPFAAQPATVSSQTFPQQSSAQALPNSFQPPLDQQFLGGFNDPSSFDPSTMNFGNQYGALEFGMLGQMAQGANNGGLRRGSTFDTNTMGPSAYINTTNDMPAYPFSNHAASTSEWQPNHARMGSWASQGKSEPFSDGRSEPNTYAIGNGQGPYMGASPLSNTTDFLMPFETTSPDNTFAPSARKHSASTHPQPSQQLDPNNKQEREHRPSKAISKKLEQLPPAKTTAQRRMNAKRIYASVIKPYPYTARFHALIAVISRRFKSQKRIRIAKALGSIRPSFISCTRTLIEEDLILMEKNFQRSLLEYRDHVSTCGTPTIICRRTGEVAYCGESFMLLSGWPHGVLLGKEPNLNVNRGSDEEAPSGTLTSSSHGGFTTPRITTAGYDPDAAVPHPVFLTDLLDADSVVTFYEDFAKIAFADSKGSVTRRCKVLKYKTKDDPLFARNRFDDSGGVRNGRSSVSGPGQPQQQDISRLGEDDGTVDCMFCWTVKRDVFEFPMMVVINFLPILSG